jgi:hypothetical protein
MSAKLFAKLWDCATLVDVMAVLKRVSYDLKPIGHRSRNNKAPIKANKDSIAAIIEGVTNGHDAVIRLWSEQGKFPKPPLSVHEALGYIAETSTFRNRPKPLVHVLLQLAKSTKFHKAHAVTIVDEGKGMTADEMMAGVLTFGSEDKVLRNDQFGSFGQGSASLFGHSQCSIIASRRAGTNKVVFTAVWLHKPEKAIHSYVYMTQPDGTLFEFDAGDLPGSATPFDGIHETLLANCPIIPRQGTVRRQLEIDGVSAYWSQRGDILYYALLDRLFGCPGYVRMAADDDPGHLNLRRGRRHEFNSVQPGELLANSQWRLMEHIPPSNAVVHRLKNRVGLIRFETWVIAGYMTKATAKDESKQATPARHMMEGSDRADPRNILVTLNGQTLVRLHSTPLFSRAKLREIAENIIVEVVLDYLPEHVLQDAEVFTASRDGLVDWFEKVVRDEVKRYLEGHEELRALAKEMMPPEDPVEATSHLSNDINKMLSDPIFGPMMGFRSGGNGTPTGAKAGNDTTETMKRNAKPPKPIKLVDPPTMLELRKETVVRNGTNYLTLHTNAPDYYGNRIELELPKFLTQVGPGYLRNGHMSVPVLCDNTALGTAGIVIARLRGTKLEDIREIEIVMRNETKKAGVSPTNGTTVYTTQGPPKFKLIELPGPSDQRWPAYFGAAPNSLEAAMNYSRDEHENTIEVALHTEFPPLLNTKQHLETSYGPQYARDFYRRVCQQYQVSAMVLCRNEMLGEDGACDASHLSVLTDMARGIIVSIGLLYRTPSFRNSVISGKEEW